MTDGLTADDTLFQHGREAHMTEPIDLSSQEHLLHSRGCPRVKNTQRGMGSLSRWRQQNKHAQQLQSIGRENMSPCEKKIWFCFANKEMTSQDNFHNLINFRKILYGYYLCFFFITVNLQTKNLNY